MNKLGRLVSANRNTLVIGGTFTILALLNLFPFPYSHHQECPNGGSYVETGRFMGLPLAYFHTSHASAGACSGMLEGALPGNSFSFQSLAGDGLVFGLIMIGVNVLVDDRKVMA